MLTRHQKMKGFTLIEVLIALFVLAIGLLGMATLMMTSMQSSQGASQRSAATLATYDLVERMRANRDRAAVANSPYAGNPMAVVPPACHNQTGGCPATDIAQFDLARWRANLTDIIPGADARIQQINNTTFCIVVFWQEPGVTQTASTTLNPCGQAANGRAFYNLQVML
jgi:type IV pilus assembly protein PilV